jgi:hypothetical protein
MQNTIRYNYGGNILVDARADKSAYIALTETSNIIEIKDYEFIPGILSNTPDTLSVTSPNYAIETESFPSGLYNRIYIHNTSSFGSIFSNPNLKFTLAQPNSFFDYDLFSENDLTFNIRISRY